MTKQYEAIIVITCIVLSAAIVIWTRVWRRSKTVPAAPVADNHREQVEKCRRGELELHIAGEGQEVEIEEVAKPTLTEICVFGEVTLECEFIENPLLIGGNLSNVWFVSTLVLKENRVLYNAIREIEDDDGEVGPAGERGPYQITPDYWQDACEEIARQYKTSIASVERLFDYEDCVQLPVASEIIMKFYWQRYGGITDELKARLHNGGPTMRGTDDYWRKVKTILKGALK